VAVSGVTFGHVPNYKGKVYAVNPRRTEVSGHQFYPTIGALPEAIDLAVIVTPPAPTVPGLVAECVKAGVKGIVVISAGFKEKGPEGAALVLVQCQAKARWCQRRTVSGFSNAVFPDSFLPTRHVTSSNREFRGVLDTAEVLNSYTQKAHESSLPLHPARIE
jgi:hypothetical protein